MRYFNFSDTLPFNQIFDDAGHITANFFIETGTLIFMVVGFLVIIIVRRILRVIATRQSDNCITKPLKKKHIFNTTVVRFLLEGSLGLSLAAAISLLKVSQYNFSNFLLQKNAFVFDHVSDSISTVCAIFHIFALIAVPFYLAWAARKVKKGEYGEEGKYKKLFEHMIPSYPSSMAFNIVFLARRFLAVLIVIFLATHPLF